MPSKKATAAAPIATGVLLVGTVTREVALQGFRIWSLLALAGGLSAVAVGLVVLTGRSVFDSEDRLDGTLDWTTIGLASLALTCGAVSAGVAMA
jgi:hypothetical protein